MNYRLLCLLICTTIATICPAMDTELLQQDYDEALARAVQLSMDHQAAERNRRPGTTADYELALQIYFQEVAHKEATQAPQPQGEAVRKQSQQELDADFALAVELSIEEDGRQVIRRSMRPQRYQAPNRLDPVEQRRRANATKMAIDNHLKGPIVPYGHGVPIFMPDHSIQLPPLIRKLPVPVCQLEVIRQREPGACGSRSVANALALRDLLARGMPIDSKSIKIMAQTYERLHTKNGLSSRDQIELARRFDLHNTYAIGFYQIDPIDNKKINPFPFTVIESTELPMVNLYQESEILENIVRLVRTQKNIVANFLCHLDGPEAHTGHGVVVSIVKRERQPTRIIYMDSNNMPIADHSQAAAYICYLYWQCIA